MLSAECNFFYLTSNLQFFQASCDFVLLQLLTLGVEFRPVIPFSPTQIFLTGRLNFSRKKIDCKLSFVERIRIEIERKIEEKGKNKEIKRKEKKNE